MNSVEKCLLDKLPVLAKTVLGEEFGLFVLVTIPDLPEFACKAEDLEDLEFASLQKHVVLMHLDVVMPGYLRKRELMVRAAMLAHTASFLRKQGKCFAEEEVLQDSADQTVERDDFLVNGLSVNFVCLLERGSQVGLTDYWGEVAVDRDYNPYEVVEDDSLLWIHLKAGQTIVAAMMLPTFD